ncbi:unnamed protein product [Eruca vesicaria subsp. sativa]|uniref:Uncharacterized protein n=1 Tax=Eruca vesicaria subsp. sativa TaxID=29727 RepID=A0ABC8L1Z8_ERUVS|nr:unnamed protein product [Eruca vesicaria subsp. sativa]
MFQIEECGPKIRQVWSLQQVDVNSVEPAIRAEMEGGNMREDASETFENREQLKRAQTSLKQMSYNLKMVCLSISIISSLTIQPTLPATRSLLIVTGLMTSKDPTRLVFSLRHAKHCLNYAPILPLKTFKARKDRRVLKKATSELMKFSNQRSGSSSK